ncbi:MAG: ABC transporter substrate-binding protein [Alphaproteobacteria bacterium]|nr:ABC transporter substrate-binding protein [Alphaproteobacteria bacterium]
MSVRSLDRRILLPLALSTAGLVLGWNRTGIASDVTGPIEQLHAGLIAIMRAGKTAPFRQRYEMIGPIVVQTFDLNKMLREAIGPRWTSLPSDQQTALADAFRRFTVASYVANFHGYSGERFEIEPVVKVAGGDRVVETRIASASGKARALDYLMRQEGGGWKVVDVLAEGSISQVAAERSNMRSVLADSGGPGLLASLRQKTAELSGGILQ